MTTQELFEQAGKPYRAIVKLSCPTRVHTSLRRSVVKSEFEAFIDRDGARGYFFNPRSFRMFYMPENVIGFEPVDTMELWSRARKAAAHIKANRIYGRELDNAFEHGDSDEMCAALWRMALRSDKLKNAITRAFPTSSILENYEKFSGLSDKELSAHAKQARDTSNAESEARIAAMIAEAKGE